MGIIRANSWNWRPSALFMIHIDVIQPGIELPKWKNIIFYIFFMTPLRNGVGRIIEIRTIKMISDTIILNQQIFTKLKKYVIYD